jgi:hypothetical protein
MENWYDYLLEYDRAYWGQRPYQVDRDYPNYGENFAFLNGDVLYIGLNLVGGGVPDAAEWANRLSANLAWVDDQYYQYENVISTMVIFCHTDPRLAVNAPFFTTFEQRVASEYDVFVVVCHRNLQSRPPGIALDFNGIDDYVILTVQGGLWPPMRVEIDTLRGTFRWNQNDWFNKTVLANLDG